MTTSFTKSICKLCVTVEETKLGQEERQTFNSFFLLPRTFMYSRKHTKFQRLSFCSSHDITVYVLCTFVQLAQKAG